MGKLTITCQFSLRRSHKNSSLQTHPQQQQQPWRGHINPSNNSLGFGPPPQMGPPAPPPLQQQTYRDQSQVYTYHVQKFFVWEDVFGCFYK